MATDKSSSLLLFRCRTTLDSNSVFSLRTSVTKSKGKFYCLFSGGNQKERGNGLIDMPAVPSEVLVIADEHASPVYIAADLLSQAITFSNLAWAPESVGDYASGTNHVLPAPWREEGLRNLGPYVATMAEIEGLDAHKRAVTLRLEDIEARQPSQTK
ncbi:hypothetical protein Bca52824_086314 [Brassica carinata]|uniref:histidinol dehydrogenase n=1 Tax=Brassica carinata TaxID=52824 RepID=A0A8X7P7L2_BRACI|nr:hypothetical protein Bca52824_086314 [Brassica carinata]